jgi:hypothetical protein
MSSQLVNLIHTVAWSEYQRRHNVAPGAGVFAIGAQTGMGMTQNNIVTKVEQIPGSSPAAFRVQDDITITITFDANTSWVEDWVMARSPQFQNSMLNHEQGHYNLVGLLARDCFIELMQLKSQQFRTRHAAQAAIAAIWRRYTGKAQPVQDLYDDIQQTHHGANSTQQSQWDGFIRTAFTQARTSGETAPDGTTYKVEILSVLTQAGLSV